MMHRPDDLRIHAGVQAPGGVVDIKFNRHGPRFYIDGLRQPRNFAIKRLVRICGNREGHLRSRTDIGNGHFWNRHHQAQVRHLRNVEHGQLRSAAAWPDQRAGMDVARCHDAVERSDDAQIAGNLSDGFQRGARGVNALPQCQLARTITCRGFLCNLQFVLGNHSRSGCGDFQPLIGSFIGRTFCLCFHAPRLRTL